MAILKWLTDEEAEKILEPCALELGKLVFAYNRMQDKLGKLYWAALGKDKGREAEEKWYSIPSDGAQRKMLKDVAASVAWPAMIQEEIGWLLDEAGKMGQKRNDAMHASYVMLTNEEGTKTVSDPFSGNKRAKNMAGKNLIKEFRWYRVCAEVLAQYAVMMHYHLLFTSQYPQLPVRPTLPLLNDIDEPSVR